MTGSSGIMNFTFVFLIAYGFIVPCLTVSDIGLGRIVFANVLFRHGDRTPVQPYPKDPYHDEKDWPVPFGQLTNLGKQQHLNLGRWLRARYAHLLSEFYTPYDIYIRSTDVDRTLMSAEANLAGLYPPKGRQMWDKINWMPIPVHTIPENEDNVLAGKKYCPRYDYILTQVLAYPEFTRINKENAELYKYLTEHTGTKVDSLRTLEHIYDTLFIESLYNKTLPDWTHEVFPDKMRPLAAKSFTVDAYNRALRKLKMGLLLGEMIEHMEKKSVNALVPDRKVWIYSAHDETVANMLMSLNVFDPHCPPYAATILIELRVNSWNEYFVTVSYKNSTEEPYLLKIPGCAALCPLKTFIALTKDIIPTDWEKECDLQFGIYTDPFESEQYLTVGVTVAFMIAIILMTVLTISVCWYICISCKDKKNYYYLPVTTEQMQY